MPRHPPQLAWNSLHSIWRLRHRAVASQEDSTDRPLRVINTSSTSKHFGTPSDPGPPQTHTSGRHKSCILLLAIPWRHQLLSSSCFVSSSTPPSPVESASGAEVAARQRDCGEALSTFASSPALLLIPPSPSPNAALRLASCRAIFTASHQTTQR